MSTKKITDKTILDDIIRQLESGETDMDGRSYATYEEDKENGILIEASVVWDIRTEENWITIDGRRYLEGTYTDIYGWDDLEVAAWIGQDKVDVDIDYIEQNLF